MDPRLAYEDSLDELVAAIQAAQDQVAAQVRDALATDRLIRAATRANQLAEIQRLLADLGGTVDPWIRQLVADAHAQGAAMTATAIAELPISAPVIRSFAGISRDAVAALQDAAAGRTAQAVARVQFSVQETYAKAGRDAVRRALLGEDGSVPRAAGAMGRELLRKKEVAQLMKEAGVGFVDSAGRGWTMKSYTEMAVRTITRQAVVEGSIARMVSHGVALAQVSQHGGSCQICIPHEGEFISLDGQTTEYEGQRVHGTDTLPPFHPNCRHTIQPVAVLVRELRRAANATGAA